MKLMDTAGRFGDRLASETKPTDPFRILRGC
jgi:hypothetical protein